MSSRGRALTTVLALALASSSAPAAAAGLTRYGSLNWRFDDITLKTSQGRTRRTQWYHGYDLNLLGPMGHPAVGTFASKGQFSDGAELSNAVNVNSPRMQRVGLDLRTEFFGPWVRKYLRFDPNVGMSDLRYSGDDARTVRNRNWGFSTGLSLPRLPALSVSRQFSTLTDPRAYNPVDDRAASGRETATYNLGPVRWLVEHDHTSIDDRLGVKPRQETDQRKASMDLNLFGLRRLPLESLSLRTDYLRHEVNAVMGQKQMTAVLNWRTYRFSRLGWENSLGYGGLLLRDHLAPATDVSQNATFDSRRPVRKGTMTNTLTFNSATGRSFSQGVNEGIAMDLLSASGTVRTDLGAAGGWIRSAAGESVTDALNGQVSFRPKRPFSLSAEVRTNGTRALGRSGGGRTNRYIAGLTVWPGWHSEVSARFDRAHARDYAAGTLSITDQLDVLGQMSPIERLDLNAAWNLGVTRADAGRRETVSTLRGGARYRFLSGVQLSAEGARTDQGYSALFSGTYTVGKTQFTLKYERNELSTPTGYSHLSIGLSRYF